MEALKLFIFACMVLQQTQGYVLMPAGLSHPAVPAGSGVFTPAQIQPPGKSLVEPASHSEQANQQTSGPSFMMLRGFNPSPAIHRMMLKRTGETFSSAKDGYYQASYLPSCYTNPSLPCFGSLING